MISLNIYPRCLGLLVVRLFTFDLFCYRKKSLITTASQGRVSLSLTPAKIRCLGLLAVRLFSFVLFCFRKMSLITTASQGRVSLSLTLAKIRKQNEPRD